MEHTKGKWEVQELEKGHHGYKDWNTYTIRSSKNVCLAVVGEVDRYHEKDHEANARLIAAAPDLLAACEAAAPYVSTCIDSVSNAGTVYEQLQTAIAKAKA